MIKAKAAKLLESLADHIDGAISFISKFCCQALLLSLKGKKEMLKITPPAEILITTYENSVFMKGSIEIIAETSLMALTTICYVIPKRQDLV